MKKLIIAIALLIPILVIGQTDTENYIKTTSYRVETQTGSVVDENKIETIAYHDGLGRVKQSTALRAGGSGEHIISHTQYDALGRTPLEYLPYATAPDIANPLNYVNPQTLKINIGNFYNTPKYEDTQNPYSQIVYEASPLNRVLEQAAPGNSWDIALGHTVKLDYQVNTNNEVRFFNVSFQGGNPQNPQLTLDGFYTEGQLYKNITKDENWTVSTGNNHTAEEFINKRGEVVLKRTYNNNLPHDTYYVYDEYGNLSFVLSPEGSVQIVNGDVLRSNAGEILDDLCYQYKYDYRNRLVEKKVPAKGWEHIVYNGLDQPILTQDANQRSQSPSQWLFTKYDAYGRVIYTGIKNANISRNTFQSIVDNNLTAVQYEERVTTPVTINGTQLYYTQNAVPTSVDEILTINYYDSYVDLGSITLPASVYGQDIISNTQSLPTLSKVRVLDHDQWITTVTGYDYKARPIYGYSENSYLGTTDTFESLLDFTGNVLESRTTHGKAGHQVVVTTDYFTYDHQNRPVTHTQQIDDEPVQLIASNSYDELGQLEYKHVGGQLFEVGYTDLVGTTVSSDGQVITKTTISDAFNAGITTIGKLETNGGLSFNVDTPGSEIKVGLNDRNTSASGFDINYFFDFYDNAGTPSYKVFARLPNGSSGTPLYEGSYDSNNSFAIEKQGNYIHYFHNGVLIASYLLIENTALIGDAGFKTPNSAISNLQLYATTIDKSLQKVDYQYNVRGWLTDINDVNSQSRTPDLFNFHINYDSVDGFSSTGSVTPLYNGNISQTTWKTQSSDTDTRSYGYAYDALNRITDGFSRKGAGFNTIDNYTLYDVSYDKNGNINTLKRNGHDSASDSVLMDNLSYTYNGNQLLKVDDLTNHNSGFKDGTNTDNDYGYDVNGNMIIDQNKKIESISYNHLNLPTKVSINNPSDNQQGTITYVYDATGTKLAKVFVDDIQQSIITTYYAKGYIYENNNGTESLKMFSHPEGYVEPVYGTDRSIQRFNSSTQTTTFSGYQYAFNYTDHLGNVRLTYGDANGDGFISSATEIISEKNYYPYGLTQKGYNDVITSNANSMAEKFAFGGKEYGEELGLDWYDISARNYDPALGRWMNIDPLSEQMRRHSPYNYAFDNPVFFIDSDGMAPVRSDLPPILDKFFRWLESKAGPTIHSAGQTVGQTIVEIHPAVVANNIYQGTLGNGKDFFDRDISKGDTALEIVTSIPLAKPLKLLKNADEVADVVNTVSKNTDDVADAANTVSKNADDVDLLQGGNRLPIDQIKEAPSKRGNAPIGTDDKPIELHHRNQTNEGPIDEMSMTDHRGGDNFKKNHPNTGGSPSLIDRKAFNKLKKSHWRKEFDSGRFDNIQRPQKVIDDRIKK